MKTQEGHQEQGQVLFRQITACPECLGKGHLIDQPCPDCEGQGQTEKHETLQVTIPKGAEEGLALGLCHYSVGDGEALPLARQLARKIADNAPFSNYLMIQAISRINDMPRADGLFTESLAAAMSQTSEGAKEGLRAFLEKRPPKFR